MSYILDALTRSQKQRERATIPTLTTDYLIDGKTREPFPPDQVDFTIPVVPENCSSCGPGSPAPRRKHPSTSTSRA